MSNQNQFTSELIYEGGQKCFDFLFFLQPRPYLAHIKLAYLNFFINIPICTYMMNTIYSTNLIG